jgi:hypothetical protein
MSETTNGQICFGIPFEEGYEFPWDSLDDCTYDGIDDWWTFAVCDYKPPVEIYDNNGNHINGIEPEQEVLDEYYDSLNAFEDANPCPVEVVNYCHADNPMIILAVPSSVMFAIRGNPLAFDPLKLIVTDKERADLIDFCKEYCYPKDSYYNFPEMKPEWYLSSYWG